MKIFHNKRFTEQNANEITFGQMAKHFNDGGKR